MNLTTENTESLRSPATAAPPQPTAQSLTSAGADRPVRYSSGRSSGAPARPLPPEEPEESFLKRRGVVIGVAAVVLGAVAYFASSGGSAPKPEVKKSAPAPVVMIKPLPPPPPPPPPKVQPPPPKQEEKKVVEEKPMDVPQAKPEPAKPAEAPMSTSLKGNGPSQLAYGRGGGVIGGTGGGGNGVGGDVFKWYAGQAARPVQDALRMHPRTRTASMRIVASIWVDGAGKIERARLDGSTGDPALDSAIQNEVLPGVALSEAPPAGMKMPIKLRLIAQRQK